MRKNFRIIWQSSSVKVFIRRDRQRSYPPAGITATEYQQHIRLCKKHQDSVIQRDASASGTDWKQYIYGDDNFIPGAASYFIAPREVFLETVKQYIESQRSEEHQPRKPTIPEETLLKWMAALFVIGAFILGRSLRTAGVFCAESL